MKNLLFICLACVLFVINQAQAQDKKVLDSLNTVYHTANHDTTKVLALLEIAFQYKITKLDTCISLTERGLQLSEQMGFDKGRANAYFNMSFIRFVKNDFTEAIKLFQQSIKIQESIANKHGLARCYSFIGNVYRLQDSVDIGLQYFHKSLAIRKEIGYNENINLMYFRMADIYLQKGDWINFIRYFSLPDLVHFVIYCFVVGGLCMMILYNLILFFNVKEPEYIYYVMCLFTSVIYITQRTSSGQVLGKIFGINGDIVVILLSLCFVLFIKSYTREVKNKTINTILSVLLIIYSWFCIDFIFFDRFLFKILYIVLIIPLSFTLIFVLWRSYNLGYKPAIYPLLASLLLAFANVIDVLANAYHLIPTHFLASISYELGLVQQSLLLSFGLSYKISVIRKENEKAQAENLRIVQEQNILLENKVKERTLQLQESNEEILQTNEELQQTLETINLQKVEIEEKNKHINDSIRYAQRIQKALLPFEENFAEHFGKDNFFILYKPKDVVSGDFYFFEEVDKKLIIMAVDCTGHGVPGAFMSMIGINLLEEIIVFQRNTNPAEILTLLHKKIRFVLKQKETKNTDGMDLSMVVINKDMQIMEFAGAKNPMIYLQNKELYTLKADKMPIGGEQKEMERIFTKQTVDISQPTTIYLFSDGYQDQFGGKNKKRFMISQMKELFLGLQDIPMLEQQNILNQTIDNWMAEGQETQIDDILVLGVKM